MSPQKVCTLTLPAWLDEFIGNWKEPLDSAEQRMQLVVALSAEKVRYHTGVPHRAAVAVLARYAKREGAIFHSEKT